MNKFVIQVIVYGFSFILCLYGLSAFDFSRFIKKNKVSEGQLLYFLIAFALAYLVGSMFMSLIYYFSI